MAARAFRDLTDGYSSFAMGMIRRGAGTLAAECVVVGLPATPFIVAAVGFGIVPVVLCALVALALLTVRLLWSPPLLHGLITVASAAGLAAVGIFVGFWAAYVVALSGGLCAAGGSSSFAGWAGYSGASVYAVIGAWGFQQPRRVLWAWPVAALAGSATTLLVASLLPHGYCET
jgi:hypothetical protein